MGIRENMINKNILVLLPLGILFSLNVFLAIGASAKGAEIVNIEGQLRELEDQNKQLTEKLVTKTSLTSVSESVGDLNLEVAKQVLYLNSPDAFAKLP